MSETITCKCPKCSCRVHDYIRKGTTEYRGLTCYECGLRFKVNIKDFFKDGEGDE